MAQNWEELFMQEGLQNYTEKIESFWKGRNKMGRHLVIESKMPIDILYLEANKCFFPTE